MCANAANRVDTRVSWKVGNHVQRQSESLSITSVFIFSAFVLLGGFVVSDFFTPEFDSQVDGLG